MVGPFLLLDGNDVGVGVEEDRGEFGIGAEPLKEDDRLALDALLGLALEGKIPSLGEDEIGCLCILGAGLGRIDLEVALESRYDR